jgi:hypothetical protein
VYSTEQLNQDNQSSNESIITLQTRNQEIDVKVVEVNNKIQKGNEFRDTLISKKHTDIDNKIAVLNPHELNLSILQFESKIGEQKSLLKQVKIVEPKEYYHEDKHDIIKESIQTNFKLKAMVDAKVHGLVQLSNSVSGGIKCEHCGIDLMNASITMAKLAELDGLRNESTSYETLLNGLNEQEKQFVQLKKDFDEYEKNKLISEKYEAAIESLELKLEQNKNLQEQYTLLQSKIEENKKTEETILKANLRLTELNSEKSILEREKGGNEVQIENLRKKIEKNNDIILKIAQEFEREKIYKIYLEV